MDSYDDTVTYNNGEINTALDPVRYAMGRTLTYAGRMDLRYAIPNDSFSSTGYALVNPGKSYFIYSPGSGSFTYTLPTGDYDYEWYNTQTGLVTATGTLTGGAKNPTPPYAEAVLFITETPPPDTPRNLTFLLTGGSLSITPSGGSLTITITE